MSCVVIFTVSSFLCGIATSLGRLILFYRRLRAKPRRPQCSRDRLREVRPALSRRRQMERQANNLGEMRQGIDRARTGTIVVHGKPIGVGGGERLLQVFLVGRYEWLRRPRLL